MESHLTGRLTILMMLLSGSMQITTNHTINQTITHPCQQYDDVLFPNASARDEERSLLHIGFCNSLTNITMSKEEFAAAWVLAKSFHDVLIPLGFFGVYACFLVFIALQAIRYLYWSGGKSVAHTANCCAKNCNFSCVKDKDGNKPSISDV
jgi:hypothetical protein